MNQDETKQQDLHDELSAYLDGELDAESVRRVEERLARDTAYHAELRRMERAWNLLDRLPRASVDETFSKSTIEMIAVAASQEAQAVQDAWPRRQRRARLWGAVGLLATSLAGFGIGAWTWPNPNRQLLEDLPVLQNLELYYQADNLEFLRLLDSENLFPEEETDHAG